MIEIKAPEIISADLIHRNKLFIAGGITGCPDWQKEIIDKLGDTDLVAFNPRRDNFPIDDPLSARTQIEWEANYLRLANMILFWFPKETLCPIVLYELGAWSMIPSYNKKLFVGVHPEYQRKQDVEIQTSIARPEIIITYSLEGLIYQVKEFIGE